MPAPLSLDLRKRIFAFRERTGASFEETAAHFDVGEATVNRLFALHRATGSLDPKHATGGLPALIGDDELPLLREVVDADNDATLKEICAAWLEKFGKKVAVSTMYRAVTRAGITLKKKSKRATERLRDDVIERKKAFIEEINAFEFDRLIFLDECGVNTSMTPRYARAMRGQRALCHVPFQRGTNISVLASVTAQGVLAWNAYDGAVDSERFVAFLADKLLPKVRRGDVLVMDNVRFHKTAEVKRIVEEAGVTLCYIPPYHPELNAAEELFSLFKSGLRRREARTLATLIEETRDILTSVGPKAAGFVRHVLNLANQPS